LGITGQENDALSSKRQLAGRTRERAVTGRGLLTAAGASFRTLAPGGYQELLSGCYRN